MSPKMDVVFKAFFSKKGNENLLEDFLSSILGEKVKCKEIIDEARVGAKRPNEKYGSLDIKAVLENGVEIDIEMQMADRKDTINRALYYMSMLTVEGLHPAEEYNQMKQKIVIFLMDYELFKLEKTIVSSYVCLKENKEQEISNLQKYYFIDLTKAKELTDKDRRRLRIWLAFLNRDKKELPKVKDDEIMKKAEEEYGYLTGDEELRRLAWLRIKAIKDEAASRALGIEEGMQKGKEEGLKQGRIEVAQNLIAEGIDTDNIVQLTGLTKEEVKKLEDDYPYLRGEKEVKRLAWLRIKAIKDEAASRALGIEEGMQKGKVQVAKKLLENGIDVEIIEKSTGLTLDKIKSL